jgi:hypothetical protein
MKGNTGLFAKIPLKLKRNELFIIFGNTPKGKLTGYQSDVSENSNTTFFNTVKLFMCLMF